MPIVHGPTNQTANLKLSYTKATFYIAGNDNEIAREMSLMCEPERFNQAVQLVGVQHIGVVVDDGEELVVLLVLARLRSVDVCDLLTTQHCSAAQLVQQSVPALQVLAQRSTMRLQAELELCTPNIFLIFIVCKLCKYKRSQQYLSA